MLIKVIPINLSFWEDALTYYVKDNQKKYIDIWSVVSLPIKNSISYWIVSQIIKNETYDMEIKSIIDILCSFPILSQYQIKSIISLSSKYFLPIHKVLNLFLPKFILNRLEKNAFQDIVWIDNPKNDIKKTKNAPQFIHSIGKRNIIDILKENIWELEDIVFVFPDDFSIDSFLKDNIEFQNNSSVYKNSLTYSQKYKIYLDILSKKNNILFWTRKILQYNLVAYKKLVYIEDSMVKYNFNQFEKYSNFDIIKSIIDANVFDVYFISSVPSVDFFYSSKLYKFDYKAI